MRKLKMLESRDSVNSILVGRSSWSQVQHPSSSLTWSRHKAFVTKVNVCTGGARGLGLCMAEGLVEAGGMVHCLDRLPEPDHEFIETKSRIKTEYGGGLEYHQVDVTNNDELEQLIAKIADEKQRLDGLIAGRSSCLLLNENLELMQYPRSGWDSTSDTRP